MEGINSMAMSCSILTFPDYFFEEIVLSRILYQLMALAAEYCEVQQIIEFAEYPKIESQSKYNNLKHSTAKNAIHFQGSEKAQYVFLSNLPLTKQ